MDSSPYRRVIRESSVSLRWETPPKLTDVALYMPKRAAAVEAITPLVPKGGPVSGGIERAPPLQNFLLGAILLDQFSKGGCTFGHDQPPE